MRCSTAVLGGWSVVGINTLTSGTPVNLSYSPAAAFSVSGSPTYRPNLIGDPLTPERPAHHRQLPEPCGRRDPDRSFAAVRQRRRATSPAGRGFAQFDLGLHKALGLGRDNTRLELRFEAFNLFNRSNFSTPNANRSNSNYGTITSTSAARQIQLGVKVHF